MNEIQYFGDNRKGISSKIAPLLITGLVIFLLILAGPASALNLSFLGLSDNYAVDEKITFTALIDINSNERLPLSSLNLNVDSLPLCSFNIDGSPISSCENVSITLLSTGLAYGYGYGYADFNGYGYNFPLGYNYGYSNSFGALGYGYGYGDVSGKLVYKVEISMPNSALPVGIHKLSLSAVADSKTFTSSETEVEILPIQEITSCQTLSSPGFYKLMNDVYSDSVCFNITSSDVSLDLNGHSLNYLLLGDMNGDGKFDDSDVSPFALALTDPANYASQYPSVNVLSGDFNSDGKITLSDLNPFRERLDSLDFCSPKVFNETLLGDMNGDGWVDSRDVDGFAIALAHPEDFSSTYPEVDMIKAGDFNSDGKVTLSDLNPFRVVIASSEDCMVLPDARNESVGIFASDVSSISIKNGEIFDFEKGILFENVFESIVKNVEVGSSHSLGLELAHSSNNIFENILLSDALNPQVSLFDSSENNVCLDCSYPDNEYVESGSEWTRTWSVSLSVNNESSSPIDGARVKAFDVFSDMHFDEFTSPSGSVSQTLPEYSNTGSIKNFNNYTLEISKSGFVTQVVPFSINNKLNLALSLVKEESGSGEPTSNNNGGGGSRRASSGESICYVGWTCSEWSACSADGSQTRTCAPASSGLCLSSPLEKPVEVQSCTPESTIVLSEEEVPQGFLSRITGAVVGALGKPSIYIPLAFIVALAVLYGYTIYRKKYSKKN